MQVDSTFRCEACAAAGVRTTRESSAWRLWGEGWALWMDGEGVGKWICSHCWVRRPFDDLKGLLGGPPSEVKAAKAPLLPNSMHDRWRQPGEGRWRGFRTWEELLATQADGREEDAPSKFETGGIYGMLASGQKTEPMPQGATPESLIRDAMGVEIVRRIGRGATATVYEVHRDGKRYALKVLEPELTEDPRRAKRFRLEAEAMAKLNHPNIVRVYEHGAHLAVHGILMELVDGTSLRKLVRGGPLEWSRALQYVEAVCDGLHHAHEARIVHRDVKPDNVFISKAGEVKIGDFGIAKLSRTAHGVSTMTKDGAAMGTDVYMAPEQDGSAGEVDRRADVYSVGIMLFELCTGELPRRAEAGKGVALRPVHPRLDEILGIATAVDPGDRYPTTEGLGAAVMRARLAM